MRNLNIYIGLLILSIAYFHANAQIEKDPTHWAYGLKKLTGNIYEVYLRCQIDDPWHL